MQPSSLEPCLLRSIGRHTLAAEEAPDHSPVLLAAGAQADSALASPKPVLTDDKLLAEGHALPDREEAPVQDASAQQAMQHGAGGTDAGRGLQRQLGQRFDRSSVDQLAAREEAAAGQLSPQAPDLQAEITPGVTDI